MKRKMLAVLLLLSLLCLSLVACGNTPAEDPCTEHVDEDGDGKCDKCGETVQTPCTEHTDEDSDGKCDKCGETVQISCTEHVDEDGDDKCDKCGDTMPEPSGDNDNNDTDNGGSTLTPPHYFG